MSDSSKSAKLGLENGAVFSGRAFGASGTSEGEVVFNTSMTGYQEILTDPSYAGQIVTLTYPHVGNVGVNAEDVESRQPFAAGQQRIGHGEGLLDVSFYRKKAGWSRLRPPFVCPGIGPFANGG